MVAVAALVLAGAFSATANVSSLTQEPPKEQTDTTKKDCPEKKDDQQAPAETSLVAFAAPQTPPAEEKKDSTQKEEPAKTDEKQAPAETSLLASVLTPEPPEAETDNQPEEENAPAPEQNPDEKSEQEAPAQQLA